MSFPQQRRASKTKMSPLAVIFRFLQNKQRVEIWLYENNDFRIEGRIMGFDEFMNMVIEDAAEVTVKSKERKELGKILLKGENVSLLRNVQQSETAQF